MSTLADLLDPAVVAALKAVATAPEPAKPTRTRLHVPLPEPDFTRDCMCERRHDGFRLVDGGRTVHKACGHPRKATAALLGKTVQPITARCSCGAQVTVLARDDSEQRKTVCQPCARAMTAGTDPVPAAPVRPRDITTTGNVPIAVHMSTTTKEPDMAKINLDSISNEDLGAMVRASMVAEQVGPLVERVAVAVEQRVAEAAVVKAEQQEVRVDLIGIGVLDGFTFKSVEVPALDVTAIPNIDEVPAGKFRSPYNKVRNRLSEPLHPSGREPGEAASTWRNLIDDHQRFAALAEVPETPVETHQRLLTTPVEQLEKAPKAKKVKAVAVEVDLDEKAKVKALRKAMGCTKAEAREMLAAIS